MFIHIYSPFKIIFGNYKFIEYVKDSGKVWLNLENENLSKGTVFPFLPE
jgi:hypothetical protein